MSSGEDRDSCQPRLNLRLPLLRSGLMHGGAFGIDGYRNGRVADFELVDGLHTQIFKGQYTRALDGFGDEVRCAANGHKIYGAIVADGVDGGGASLSFAHHAEQAGLFQHLARELVHARGGGGAGGTDNLFAYRVNRT